MRKFLISAALLTSVAIAAPAAAQPRHGGYGHNQGYGQSYGGGAQIAREINQLERQIDRLRERRLISQNEARRLGREANHIDRLHDRYRRNGLTAFEARDLRNRIQRLSYEVRAERREGREDRRDDRRADRRGW